MRRLSPGRRMLAALVTMALTATALLLAAPAANAATLGRTTLSATVNGTTVSATTRITSSPVAYASLAGICARGSTGAHYDFPLAAATLTTGGTTLTRSRTFPAGTYTYWACAKVNGVWNDVGAKQSFTVGATSGASGGSGGSTGGAAMPVGDLTGWKQVFTDDFSTNVAAGSFPGAYAAKWTSYHGFYDTFGTGYYDRSAISVQNGTMDLHLRTQNGRPIAAAPAPIVTRAWEGQTYGRFSVRFKSDSLPGYKAAWLLWPDSDNWNQGEIDFPEGGLSSTIWGFNHCVGNPSSNCYYVDTKASFTSWHTATIEWMPGRLNYILDGRTVGTTTSSVPTSKMHWVLQTETDGSRPSASTAGHVLIDWVTVYTYTG